MHMFRQCCVQHANGCRTMFCHTVQYLDSVVSNSPMVGLCCVQLSDGLWAECPTVQWSDCAFSNCPMVGQSCVQLSKGRIMLCQTVQWLDSVVSNSPMVSQCYYNYKKRSPRRRARYLNSKMDDYIVLNCLVGCINIFLIIYLLYQNVAKFRAFSRTVWDSKSYYIGQFKIFCTPGVATRFTLDGAYIERQSATKILGVWIGEDPSCWERNTKEIMKRTYASMSILTKLKYAGLSREKLIHIFPLFVRSYT